MEGNLLSISKIFTERLLRIPDYQRGYAWGKKEVNEFWLDLSHLEKGKSHYVGVLTLEDVPEDTVKQWREDHWIIYNRGYASYYVVDGQQRITTTIILIQAIVEAYEKKFSDDDDLSLNYTSMKEIRDKFIFMCKGSTATRSYLFGYEKDNPSYEHLKSKVFMEKSINHGNLEETIYTSNLTVAKNFFLEKLSELDKDGFEELYQKITQNFLFNIYSLDKEIDTYVAFETMNNRGKSLSHLELLKNRLIFLTTKLPDEKFHKDDLRHSINECWKAMYHYLGKSKDNPLDDDDFLYSHFNLYFHSDDNQFNIHTPLFIRRDLYIPRYKEILLGDIFSYKSFQDKDNKNISISYIYNYVSSLKESVEFWYDIYNPSVEKLGSEVEKWLFKIRRIRNWETSSQLILSVFRTTSDENIRIKFLRCIERALFIEHHIFRRVYLLERGELLSLAKKLHVKELSIDEIISQVNARIEDSLKVYRNIWTQEFSKNSDFYGWSGIRYVLFEYEMSLLEKYKSKRTKLIWSDISKSEPWSEYITVEHVYPQTPRSPYWKERFNYLNPPQRKKLKNSIGNLVPLSKSKNSSLSNKPFPDKSYEGFKYGCYSENELTKNTDWTPKEIIDRNISLIKFIDTRWKLGIGSSKDAILKFSGLNDIDIIVRRYNN